MHYIQVLKLPCLLWSINITIKPQNEDISYHPLCLVCAIGMKQKSWERRCWNSYCHSIGDAFPGMGHKNFPLLESLGCSGTLKREKTCSSLPQSDWLDHILSKNKRRLFHQHMFAGKVTTYSKTFSFQISKCNVHYPVLEVKIHSTYTFLLLNIYFVICANSRHIK